MAYDYCQTFYIARMFIVLNIHKLFERFKVLIAVSLYYYLLFLSSYNHSVF